MSDTSFETALGARVDDMLDACTRCGKCVEACPSVAPAGIADASSTDIISGILDILRTGDGPEASRKWASACMRSGDSPSPVAIDGNAVLTIVVSSICMNAAVATSHSMGRSDGKDGFVGAITFSMVGAIRSTGIGAIVLCPCRCDRERCLRGCRPRSP